MALDKSLMIAGAKVQVQSLKSKTAGIIIGNNLSGICVWSDPGTSIAFKAGVGDILEIVKKPRKIFQSINCCRVRSSDGMEGEVYWTELRSNCKLIEDSNV